MVDFLIENWLMLVFLIILFISVLCSLYSWKKKQKHEMALKEIDKEILKMEKMQKHGYDFIREIKEIEKKLNVL